MQASSREAARKPAIFSKTFPADRLNKILSTPGSYHEHGHFEYPASERGKTGNHLDALFLMEPIVKQGEFVDWIVEDINNWMTQESIMCDLILAPAQPSVQPIVDKLAARRRRPVAYWGYLPTGWFGDDLVSGKIEKGSTAFIFNAVSHTGRCIGERLPGFAEKYGAEVKAVGAFALGTTSGAEAAKAKFGKNLYRAIEVPLNLYPPHSCPICASNIGGASVKLDLRPWTAVRDRG
jgi:hypothetical protein